MAKKRLPQVPDVLRCKFCGSIFAVRLPSCKCPSGTPTPRDEDVRTYLGREPDPEPAR